MPHLPVPEELINIAKAVSSSAGNCILVGGAVRDYFLYQQVSKDLDVEVYGMSPENLEEVLSKFGAIHAVGKSFGVLKLKTASAEYDFSLPRRENKTGKGHRGFIATADPDMNFQEAASRRDFTVNSIGYDLLTQTLLDPYDGIGDIKRKILRHTGPAFSEDPLRVLRAMQFSARLEFDISADTVLLCRKLDLTELSRERVFEEFCKLLLKSKQPSLGFNSAKILGILDYFPELKALLGVPQDPEWHPEGDVWVHTLLVLDEAAKLRKGEYRKDLELMLAALCHDFGKPLTTEFLRGRWRSPAHDVEGVAPTVQFLLRLTNEQALIQQVTALVKEHLRPVQLYKDREKLKSGTIRRLALRVSIPEIVLLATADYLGRALTIEERAHFKPGEWLLLEAERIQVRDEPPRPILMGRHLLEMGLSPGPEIGAILKQAFEIQLNGELQTIDEALKWAKSYIAKLSHLAH
ncbi:MAG: HD domain-containing protein [SAR324 cluster bacterium]|nr:HD domain-containing protein [SAR324 cluster bacterium]